jgi:predicted aminopeptidase
MKRRRLLIAVLALAVLLTLLGSCSNLGYYGHTLSGGAKILAKRRPIDRLLNDPGTDAELKEQLSRVMAIRDFATSELALPDNKSYRTYSNLDRRYAVWNVVAAPELSIHPLTWCFPVAGCVSYRGYFSREKAEKFAERLRERSYEVDVGGVSAYSTLGWFSDPVLSTFLHYPEADLAGLIFHELAHQVAYVQDDTTFNESFATAVELAGVDRWLAASGDPDAAASYRRSKARQDQFVALVLESRERLERAFAADRDDEWKRAEKERLYAEMRAAYERLKIEWGGYDRYDAWFSDGLTNARLATIGAYRDLVPAFEALLDEHEGNLEAFYRAVGELAELAQADRSKRLRELAPERPRPEGQRRSGG